VWRERSADQWALEWAFLGLFMGVWKARQSGGRKSSCEGIVNMAHDFTIAEIRSRAASSGEGFALRPQYLKALMEACSAEALLGTWSESSLRSRLWVFLSSAFQSADPANWSRHGDGFIARQLLTAGEEQGGFSFCSLTDAAGCTVLHYAATAGRLRFLPSDVFTEKNMAATNIRAASVWHDAAEAGCLADVPRRLLSRDVLVEKDDSGNTPLHAAAKIGILGQVDDFLDKEALLLRNSRGETPLHIAADAGTLTLFPGRWLIEELLLAVDNDGDTPVHAAASRGFLFQVTHTLPSALVSETVKRRILAQTNGNGLTPLSLRKNRFSPDAETPR
jgi:hypothetical protein